MSESKATDDKKLTRRGFIRWSTALGVVAAAVVGLGVGYGAELLTRPTATTTATATATQTATTTATATATQTATQTATETSTLTTTVAPPVTTISYVPPLSSEVQQAVTTIENNLVSRTAGETVTYTTVWPFWGGPYQRQFMKVRVKNGLVIGITSDDTVNTGVAREDSNWTGIMQGQIQCRGGGGGGVRSYTYPGYMYRPERLLYPMMKVGARGDPLSQFVRITWDQAFSAIATEMQSVVTKYGPYSIAAWYTGSLGEAAYLNAGCTGWGIASNESANFATEYVYGSAYGAGASDSDIPGLFSSKLIVLWGVDPTDTSLSGEFGYYVRLAKEKGIPVICIDVMYTKAAEVLADQYIPIKAGTDSAMMIAVANVLFTENLIDQDFVSKFVEPTGLATWKDYVMGVSDGINKTPAWQEPITGVPAATVQAFAELYASSKPTWLVCSWGASRQALGENTARAALYLQALTGNIGIVGGYQADSQGGGWPAVPTPESPGFGGFLPPGMFGSKPASYVTPVLFKNYKWADAVLLKPQYDSGQITQKEYYDTIGNAAGNPAPNIKFIWFNTNLINQTNNINKEAEAVKAVEMAVSAVWYVDQPTAMLSDIILPRAEMFEEDPVYNSMGYMGYALSQKLVQPQGEVMSILQIHVGIATALGVVDQSAPALANLTQEQWDAAQISAMQTNYEAWATANNVTTSWEDFLKVPIWRTPLLTPAAGYAAQITGGQKFGTASGQIEFYSNYLATTDLTTTKYGGPISPYAAWIPQPQGYYDPMVQTYPLMLISPHSRYRLHSWQDGDPMLNSDVYRHALWINVADANARGIVDGDMIRVYNDTGEAVIPAYVTSKIVPGAVHLFEGGWFAPTESGTDLRGAPNIVQPDTANPAGQWPFHGLVEVEKF